MNTRPLTMPPVQRELLREFERLHEEWRAATQAADAIECTEAPCALQEPERLLRYRLAADSVHQKAMRLLRDTPI